MIYDSHEAIRHDGYIDTFFPVNNRCIWLEGVRHEKRHAKASFAGRG